MADRKILHCDCNSFFAEVLLREQPWLRKYPVVVGGNEENRHGIVLAKNYVAKPFGIKTGMSLTDARRLCRDLVTIPITDEGYDLIGRASDDFFSILGEYTDLVEPFGCDGGWLDVTGTAHLFGGIFELAHTIQQRMLQQEGLPVSIGISWNKVFSKLASEQRKPGITAILRTGPKDTSWQPDVFRLPVDELVYIGRSRKNTLGRFGIRTLGDLHSETEEFLCQLFGIEGSKIYSYVHGTENAPVVGGGLPPPMKSIGNGATAKADIDTWEKIWYFCCVLAERTGERMRAHRWTGSTIHTSVCYVDDKREMRYEGWQAPMEMPTNLSMDIAHTAFDLLRKRFQLRPIRKLSIKCTKLGFVTDPFQCSLAMDLARREEREKLEEAIDGVNNRWRHCVRRCVTVMDKDIAPLGSKASQAFAPPGIPAV